MKRGAAKPTMRKVIDAIEICRFISPSERMEARDVREVHETF